MIYCCFFKIKKLIFLFLEKTTVNTLRKKEKNMKKVFCLKKKHFVPKNNNKSFEKCFIFEKKSLFPKNNSKSFEKKKPLSYKKKPYHTTGPYIRFVFLAAFTGVFSTF
jgi:hypothetical protein